MLLKIILWVLLLGLAGVGSAVQAFAVSVRDRLPQIFASKAEGVRRLDFWGGAVSGGALAVAAMLTVLFISDAGSSLVVIVLSIVAFALVAAVVEASGPGIARRNFDRLARLFFGPAAIFLPVVEPVPQSEEAREETMEQMVEAGEKAGLIESDEHEMITGILQLDRTSTRDIMVPRIDVIALEVDTPMGDALDVVIAGAHSRVPVYEGSVDHILGLVYAKDLLRELRQGKTDVALRSLLRTPYFVPESKRLDELLQELQQTQVHMAIVVDEYGGTAGIVTIEDVLEEIVGEIQDEYDIGEEPLVEEIGANMGVFNARINIDEVNERLGLHLPTENTTLGGLVYQRLEKMPRTGDQAKIDDVVISVLSVVGRRIKKVRVEKQVQENEQMTNEQMTNDANDANDK